MGSGELNYLHIYLYHIYIYICIWLLSLCLIMWLGLWAENQNHTAIELQQWVCRSATLSTGNLWCESFLEDLNLALWFGLKDNWIFMNMGLGRDLDMLLPDQWASTITLNWVSDMHQFKDHQGSVTKCMDLSLKSRLKKNLSCGHTHSHNRAGGSESEADGFCFFSWIYILY